MQDEFIDLFLPQVYHRNGLMHRVGSVLIFKIFLIFFPSLLLGQQLQFDVRGTAAILIDAKTGMILFEKNSEVPHYPASTTKIATALTILQNGSLDWEEKVTAQREALLIMPPSKKKALNYAPPASYRQEADGTHIAIREGEELSIKQLFQGMMIASGNDAANVLALHLAPSIPDFVHQMNEYLKSLGCLNTHFTNPHGLHDPSHQTTAYDLSLIAKEAMKYPIFAETVAQMRFSREKTNKQGATTYLQGNRLLRPGKFRYSKAIGIKTGYHSKAKKTFVGAAALDDRVLIAVLLGYERPSEVFEDAIALFETAFNQPKVRRTFLKEGEQKFTRAVEKGKGNLRTRLKEPLYLEYYPAENPEIKCFLQWNALSAPIRKGETVGKVQLVTLSGEVLKTEPLIAEATVPYSLPFRLWHLFVNLPWTYIFIFELATIIFLVFYLKKKRM